MKEKMLTKLERDRAVGQVAGLQSTLKNIEGMRVGSEAPSSGKMICNIVTSLTFSGLAVRSGRCGVNRGRLE